MNDPDLTIAHLVRHREGVLHRREATAAGFTPKMIRHRCRSGVWNQLDRDVFALAVFPATWRQRCIAATFLHPAAALSHSTSATHLGLDGFRPGRVQIAVPPVANHQSSIAQIHRSRHIQFEVVGGIRTSTFAQTMVQLAGSVPDRSLRSALHSGLHQRHERADELRQRIGELADRRMPGMRRLVDALEDLDGTPPTASELERLLADVLDLVPGMPPVDRQVSMPWRSDRDTLVDAFVPAWGLVLEADGRSWHTRVGDFEVDRWRDNEATSRGLHVMRFTWHRLRDDRTGVIDQLVRFGRFAAQRAA